MQRQNSRWNEHNKLLPAIQHSIGIWHSVVTDG